MSTISSKVTTPVILSTDSAYGTSLEIAAGGAVEPAGYTGAIGVMSDTAGVSLTVDAATTSPSESAGRIYGGVSAANGVGGAAVDFTASATLSNSGVITGGNGNLISETMCAGGTGVEMTGTLGNYDNIGGGTGCYGGAGGVGVDLTSGTLTNGTSTATSADIHGGNASMQGGSGGTGLIMSGGTGTSWGTIEGGTGTAGAGGVGAIFSNGASFTNHYQISGGGSSGTAAGGDGVILSGSSSLVNDFDLRGASGNTTGSGAGGGAGAVLMSGTTLTSNQGATISGAATISGRAGDGVDLSGTASLTNSGDITGGQTQTSTGGAAVLMTGGGSLVALYERITGGAASSATGVAGIGVEASGTATSIARITVRYEGRYIGEGEIFGGSSYTSTGGTAAVAVDLGVDAALSNSGEIEGGSTIGANTHAAAGLLVSGSTQYNANIGSGLITGGSADGANSTAGTGVDLATPGANLTNLNYVTGGDSLQSSSTGGIGVEVDAGAIFTNLNEVFGGPGYNGGTGNVGLYLKGGTAYNAGTINGNEKLVYGVDVFADSVNFGTVTGGKLVLESHDGRYGLINGKIEGFQIHDYIQVDNATLTQAGNASGSTSAGTYQISTPHDGTLYFSGTYAGEHFTFTTTGGNTTIGLADNSAPCFRRGTRIQTPDGERAVESLRIGDAVTTQSGAPQPIRWIGRRRYSQAAAALDADVLPIRIRTGALAPGVPHRDLWVSPEHALWIDGMLIPARELVNGSSIVQESAAEEVSYFHLEFDGHAVIYAEGAPAESYADDGARGRFDNAAEYHRVYPLAAPAGVAFIAPRVEDGEALEAVRRRLAARAAGDRPVASAA